MKLLIVQTSPARTGSTVLSNALYGMIPEFKDHPCVFVNRVNPLNEALFNNVILIKTHLPIDHFRKNYGMHKLVFICSQRKELNRLVPDKEDDVVVFDYEELNETKSNPLPQIIDNIYNKVQPLLPMPLDKKGGITRITAMNARYIEIEKKPFNYHDPFFHLHGSHRNRG
jgi:hypothetical protein